MSLHSSLRRSSLPTAQSAAETSSSKTDTGGCNVRHCCEIASNWLLEVEATGSLRWLLQLQLCSAVVRHCVACLSDAPLSSRLCVCALSLLSLLICSLCAVTLRLPAAQSHRLRLLTHTLLAPTAHSSTQAKSRETAIEGPSCCHPRT